MENLTGPADIVSVFLESLWEDVVAVSFLDLMQGRVQKINTGRFRIKSGE